MLVHGSSSLKIIYKYTRIVNLPHGKDTMAANRFMHRAAGNPQAFPPLRKPCSLATKATVTETEMREDSSRPSSHKRVSPPLAVFAIISK